MKNSRCLEQALGRCGRQGQPGTATVYIDPIDKYQLSGDFDEKQEWLMKLQENFSNYLRTGTYKWIYEVPMMFPMPRNIKFPFGISQENLMKYLK